MMTMIMSIDEDGYEDLNKDGLITLMRIKDPAGRFIESDEDERIMVEADISKGQSGNYLVYSEGIDNDKDGSFNEDGPGGVDFNRNFTFNYESFGLKPECILYLNLKQKLLLIFSSKDSTFILSFISVRRIILESL